MPDRPTISPDEALSRDAASAVDALAELIKAGKGKRSGRPVLEVRDGARHARIDVSREVLALIHRVLQEVAGGSQVTIASDDRLLAFRQAATLLGISKPRLIYLMDVGILPTVRVRARRRIRFRDLMAYKRAEESAERMARGIPRTLSGGPDREA